MCLFLAVYSVNSMSQTKEPKIDKTNLLQYVFSKKWSLDDIACNRNGGAYVEFNDNDPWGEILTANGKANSSKQKATHQFIVTGDNSFTLQLTIYNNGNKTMEDLMNGNDQIVGKFTKTYRLVSPNKLEFNSQHEMIDLDTLLKNGSIRYDYKTEQGFRNRCPNDLGSSSLAPVGKKLRCIPNQNMINIIQKDSGKEPFPFDLSFTRTNATVFIGTTPFVLKYKGDAGEKDTPTGEYVLDNASMTYFYKTNVSIVKENDKFLTAGVCK